VVRLSGENVYGESTCIWVRVDLVQAVYRALDADNIICTAIEMSGSIEDTFQLYGVTPDDIATQLGWMASAPAPEGAKEVKDGEAV